MNLLSLDLSIASTGYSVFVEDKIVDCNRIVTVGKELSKKSKKCLDYKYFFASTSEDDRIYYLSKIINEITKKYKITDYCIEDQFIGKNARTGLTLAKVKGSVIYVGKDNDVNIHHLKPTEVRKYLMNIGSASKENVAKYIRNNYYDAGEFSDKYNKYKTDDKYDALACGIALLKKNNIIRS